jgi:hypothetical protein
VKPWIHAQSSAKKYGGKPEDYIEIHNLMDSSKGAIADNRHRVLTHTSWFLSTILERIFGVTIENSDGKKISVRDIGEQHILEDFRGKFIPTPQDFIEHMEFQEWMNNATSGVPSSYKNLRPKKKEKTQIQQLLEENIELTPAPEKKFYDGTKRPEHRLLD